MRFWPLLFCGAALLVGCATTQPTSHPPAQATTKPIITPDFKVTGKIVMANAQARFVVVNFPIGSLPEPDRRLNVYRGGLKIGEVKIADWKKNAQMKIDSSTVADLVAGEAQVNDEVKEN